MVLVNNGLIEFPHWDLGYSLLVCKGAQVCRSSVHPSEALVMATSSFTTFFCNCCVLCICLANGCVAAAWATIVGGWVLWLALSVTFAAYE